MFIYPVHIFKLFRYIACIFCGAMCSLFSLYAQNSSKREFRGAWIATVSNIDFPSAKGLSAQQQQNEFIGIVNQHQASGINAVIVQIRTNADALYPTDLAPWSEWLSGKQGLSPGYDILAFMIAECHKRGIEFHAWFNPYRAVSNINTSVLASNHIAIQKPSWLLSYGNLRILDPGNPSVRNHVIAIVMDVLRRYDIDGVHFDDYFYPYPQTGLRLNDDATFVANSNGFSNRADWRRNNVDLLIQQLSDSIRSTKPWIKFGISPFGIWQNKNAQQPLGSATNGLQSYSDIYADSRKWLQNSWIDYIAPQLYWNIGLSVADYAVLIPWWASNSFGRHLYIGMASYRIGASDSQAWQNPSEMPNQIRLNRQITQGNILYNTTSVNKNLLGFRDSLRNSLYRSPALMPTMPWKKATVPNAPSSLSALATNNGILLRWNKATSSAIETDKIRGYVIYRFENDEIVNLNKANAIRYITPNDTTAFLDSQNSSNVLKFNYLITAIDRLHNESLPSNHVSITNNITGISSVSTISKRSALFQNYPNPFDKRTRIPYYVAEDGIVSLKIQNYAGKEFAILINEWQAVGQYEIEFNSKDLPSGIYFCVLQTVDMLEAKRLILY